MEIKMDDKILALFGEMHDELDEILDGYMGRPLTDIVMRLVREHVERVKSKYTDTALKDFLLDTAIVPVRHNGRIILAFISKKSVTGKRYTHKSTGTRWVCADFNPENVLLTMRNDAEGYTHILTARDFYETDEWEEIFDD